MVQSTLIGEILALTSGIKATPPTSSPGILLRERLCSCAVLSRCFVQGWSGKNYKVTKKIKSLYFTSTTRLVWLQLELVATSLDLSWPPNSPLSPRPINTIKWISKEVPSSPCHRWRIPALDTIYAPILRSPHFLQVTFPQLRMTAVTLAPFTNPISFPEAAILMHSDGDR